MEYLSELQRGIIAGIAICNCMWLLGIYWVNRNMQTPIDNIGQSIACGQEKTKYENRQTIRR